MDARTHHETHGMRPRGELPRFQPVPTEPLLGAGPTDEYWTPVDTEIKTKTGEMYRITARRRFPIEQQPEELSAPAGILSLAEQGYTYYIAYVVRKVNEGGTLEETPKTLRVYCRDLKRKKKRN